MKFTTSLLVILFLFSFASYAQDAKGEIIFKELLPTEKTTISVNINGYDMDKVGALKDELLAYEEKVANVKINDKQTQMFITYSGTMLQEDLIRAFNNQGIAYRTPPSSTSAIQTKED